ncbi:MAG: galactokinase [Bdellovibrionaceae bacterium]|nr:galactokinase [Pseudobdellovibrionaceae bacterium]|tara:strand:- start:18067 stop:19050 length:984 start_codon:yes stop_codon:yes gene_type:complete
MEIQKQTPTRVDLAGGTLDFWPIYLLIDKAMTINCSISIFSNVKLSSREDGEIHCKIENLNFEKTYSNHDDFVKSKDPEVLLVQVVAEYFGDVGGYSIRTHSQSPVGGGLGGSSSLCVAIIQAYLQKTGKTLELVELATLAANLEAKVLKTPTGMQDHFPAANVGLNCIRFGALGPEVENIDFDSTFFNKSFFLVDTGKAHHSGINNWSVFKSVIEGDQKVIAALNEINRITHMLYGVLKEKQYDALPELFNQEYEARIQLAKCFSSPEIEKLREITMNSGALSVKICGAGGGGCVLVMTEPNTRQRVMESCQNENFQPLEIQFLTS